MEFILYRREVITLMRGWHSSNTWDVPWIKQMKTSRRYGRTSSGRRNYGIYL